jgi:hypothetical protein
MWPRIFLCHAENTSSGILVYDSEKVIYFVFKFKTNIILSETYFAKHESDLSPNILGDGSRRVKFLVICFSRFALMACCWLGVPEERPTFVQLLACLQEFYTALGRYI